MKFSFSKIKWISVLVFILGITGSGCLKTSDIKQESLLTYISILHLANSAPSTEIYFNNKKETSAMASGSYFAYYAGVNPGVKEVSFKKSGSDSLLAYIPSTLYDSLAFHTLILYDAPDGNSAVAAQIEDDFSTMASDKTTFRFFNMSRGAASVDFYINDVKLSSARTPADNIANENFNMFQRHEPGTFVAKVKQAGTDILIAETTGVSLNAATAYTFFLKGKQGGTGNNALSLAVIRAAN